MKARLRKLQGHMIEPRLNESRTPKASRPDKERKNPPASNGVQQTPASSQCVIAQRHEIVCVLAIPQAYALRLG